MTKLTARTIEALQPSDTRYDLADKNGVSGLALRVAPSGRKSWTFRYRNKLGQQRRQSLGTFPSTGLADARTEAQKVLNKVASGNDPAKDIQANRRALITKDISTLSDLWDRYRIERGLNKRSADSELGFWLRLVQPSIGKVLLDDLTKQHFRSLIRSIGDGENGRPTTANRVHSLVRLVLNFGVDIDVIDVNPIAGLKTQYEEVSRDRVLSDIEIRTFWNGLTTAKNVSMPIKISMRLALLTGQRRAEIAGMKKDELDLAALTWTIGRERAKNNKTHLVPLSEAVVELLNVALGLSGESEYVFSSPVDRTRPIHAKALTRAWRRVSAQIDLEDVRLHDFRRTCATGLQKLGVRLEVTEAVLNHTSGSVSGVAAVYQRHDWKEEKRLALEMWAKQVLQIVNYENDFSNIIDIRGRA